MHTGLYIGLDQRAIRSFQFSKSQTPTSPKRAIKNPLLGRAFDLEKKKRNAYTRRDTHSRARI